MLLDIAPVPPHLLLCNVQSILQISEWQLEGDRIKSKLEIDPARQMDSGNYECQADNKYAIDSRTFKADFSSLGS